MKRETLQESTWAALWATDGFHNVNKCPTRVGSAPGGAYAGLRVQWLDSLTARPDGHSLCVVFKVTAHDRFSP